MLNRESTTSSILYQLARFSPALCPILTGYLALPSAPESAEAMVMRYLIFIGIIIVWSMAEGVVMLWVAAKAAEKREHSGYLIVGLMLLVALMGLLQLYRIRTSQILFVMLLATLTIRGASRSSWERGRAKLAIASSFAGAALVAMTALATTELAADHMSIGIALAFGGAVATMDVAWYSDRARELLGTKWPPALFRVMLFIGPVLISVIAANGGLPLIYGVTVAALAPAARLSNRIGQGGLPSISDFGAVTGTFYTFLGILIACRLYVMGAIS